MNTTDPTSNERGHDADVGKLVDAASLLSFVKACVTGERYDGGENERVGL